MSERVRARVPWPASWSGGWGGRSVFPGCSLVGQDATVDALFVLRVPPQLSLGAGMAEEEAAGRAVVVFVSTLHAPPSEHALGPTTTYLLERRPCRIVVETDPNGHAQK